jgi:hypothetical protein
MKAYIQKGADGQCINVNAFVAYDGFRQMGWEIDFYQHGVELIDSLPDEVVVGSIYDVRSVLQRLSALPAESLDYPVELRPYLGRKLWESTVNTVASDPDSWPVFIKPRYFNDAKAFTGRVVRRLGDLIGCGNQQRDVPVWCADALPLVAEWRCFVRYGQVVDVRRYHGAWFAAPDPSVVHEVVKAFASAPAGYAIDFALTEAGQTILLEVNDGHSVGAYGLTPLQYAKLLSARWAHLTGTTDYCNF